MNPWAIVTTIINSVLGGGGAITGGERGTTRESLGGCPKRGD